MNSEVMIEHANLGKLTQKVFSDCLKFGLSLSLNLYKGFEGGLKVHCHKLEKDFFKCFWIPNELLRDRECAALQSAVERLCDIIEEYKLIHGDPDAKEPQGVINV